MNLYYGQLYEIDDLMLDSILTFNQTNQIKILQIFFTCEK